MGLTLITGGNGFLGTHLRKQLLKNGEDVRIFDLFNDYDFDQTDSKYEILHGDIRDKKAVENAVKGVDRVIHLVSNSREKNTEANDIYSINVEGTKIVLDAALKFGIKRFVHCSSVGVHGSFHSIAANELTEFNPRDLYQKTKLMAEVYISEFYHKTGLPISVIRPLSMMGPGDFRMLSFYKMIQQGRFFIIGNGSVLFQLAYIDDVVDGFILCLNNKDAIGETFIIGGEEYLSYKELCSLVAIELGVLEPLIYIPQLPVIFIANLFERVCAPLGIEPPLQRQRVKPFQDNRVFSIAKAKKMLNFRPKVSLSEGVMKTIQWYEANGLL